MCDCIDKTLESVALSTCSDDIEANSAARRQEAGNLKPPSCDKGKQQTKHAKRDDGKNRNRNPFDTGKVGNDDEHEARAAC